VTGDAAAFLRFCAGLPGFFRRPLDAATCRQRIADGIAARERNFLAMLEHGVYGRPSSPYRALLSQAGAELADVARLVDEDGVEGALERLRRKGVYVTLEEFKRRRPITRPGLELPLDESAFDNPLVGQARVTLRSEGSRGRQRHAMVDLDHLEHEAL